ncbi:hypothetical protein DICVIV_05462 [Dictyocaulus viviparus]|uniref:Proline-rich protein PRCC n=1 Tax=Dictyocaulus viviparus TaxID=29172 RepID=A0A0D8XX72_DICVI|nr:hypothetical protein DICVIV_05462 [Dictyocaulus viviparus]
MLSLLDYGSGSEDEINETLCESESHGPILSTKTELCKSSTNGSHSKVERVVEGGASFLNLPPVLDTNLPSTFNGEDDLEDMVKPKNWEIKLAEKERKLMEKKAKKKAKKEKRRSRNDTALGPNEQSKSLKGKTKISAFGALNTITSGYDSDKDDDKISEPVQCSVKPKVSGLLAMLPLPKSKQVKDNSHSDIGCRGYLPRALENKNKQINAPAKRSSVLLCIFCPMESFGIIIVLKDHCEVDLQRPATSDESDDDDSTSDFFGLSSVPEPKIPKIGNIPTFVHGLADMAGPSRTENYETEIHGYPQSEISSSDSPSQGIITDEEAKRLIIKHEIGTMGPEHPNFNSFAADIVDIRVDDALGPDVRSTLLKNLHNAARAKDAMAPLPKSKNPADATSRRKHQITYLANLAVAREEALQQQWAENKQMRRMGRQKYGF